MKNLAAFVLIGTSILSACQSATPLAAAPLTPVPTNTAIPTETSIPSPTNEPTPTLEAINGGWSTFYAEEYGFSFLYPAVYDEGFYDTSDPFFCNIQARKEEGKFKIWVGIVRIVVDKTEQSLENIADAYVREKSTAWTIRSQTRIEIDGIAGVTIEYGRVRPPRWGSQTFVVHDNDLLAIDFYEGNFIDCGPTDIGYSSYWVYEQVINTLKFDN